MKVKVRYIKSKKSKFTVLRQQNFMAMELTCSSYLTSSHGQLSLKRKREPIMTLSLKPWKKMKKRKKNYTLSKGQLLITKFFKLKGEQKK